ncbi:hypothetical protein LCGC14_2260920, partial [marine sediment metagenome]
EKGRILRLIRLVVERIDSEHQCVVLLKEDQPFAVGNWAIWITTSIDSSFIVSLYPSVSTSAGEKGFWTTDIGVTHNNARSYGVKESYCCSNLGMAILKAMSHVFEVIVGDILESEGEDIVTGLIHRILPPRRFRSPEPADASKYLTPEELEHGFPEFQKAIDRRRKEEQADQT